MAKKTKPAQPEAGPQVNFVRCEVTELMPRWTLIRDVLSGDEKIKSKKTDYLPQPNPTDKSPENEERYKQYLQRAIFYGVTARTLRGMTGEVFARDPVLVMPDDMEVMKEDANGAGLSLNQLARKAVNLTIAHGRAGVLADYPKTAKVATKAQLRSGEIRPTITLFEPWDIINWREVTVNGRRVLTLVVISEQEVVDDDGFAQEYSQYFRVLRLRNGVYQTETWSFDDGLNAYVQTSVIIPTKGDGKTWDYIPFSFIGSENNDATPDLPPLYDLARLNVGHYCNSADYEESCFIMGQPTPYFAGLTETWVTEVLKGTIRLGARAAVLLPENATAGMLQVEPNTMPMEAMKHKEEQMVAIGAKLVEQKVVPRTAAEAGMDEAANHSLLATCAVNVSHGLTCALRWCGEFLNLAVEEPTDLVYELNTDFNINQLDANDLAQLVAAWQSNALTFEEMRDRLKRGGMAYLADDVAMEQMETAGLDLGIPVGSPASQAAAKAAADAKAKAKAAKAKPGSKSGKP